MSNPEAGAVIRGTGGLRKIRFASEEDNRGKRGSDRICYAFFPSHHLVLMVAAFSKNRKEDLSTEASAIERETVLGELTGISMFPEPTDDRASNAV